MDAPNNRKRSINQREIIGKLKIVDTTLRDGEQSPGVAFTIQDKIEIALALEKMGVDVIEAGIPVMGNEEMQSVYEILNLNLKAEILTWNRMRYEDVRSSMVIGAKNIHISVPASDLHILKKLNSSRDAVVSDMCRLIELVKSQDGQVSIGAEDASRADETFLISLFQKAVLEGAYRVRYADTVSALDPFTTFERITRIKQQIQVPIDFHGHNDFGLGTANALAAFKAGAHYISCSMNGLGERAGNTALEEIVTAIAVLEKQPITIDLQQLQVVSALVEKCSGRRIHESKPVVGSAVFSHEAGIHVDGLMKDSRTYEFLIPELVGRKRIIVYGKHSGRNFSAKLKKTH